jgi:hypothetical protein
LAFPNRPKYFLHAEWRALRAHGNRLADSEQCHEAQHQKTGHQSTDEQILDRRALARLRGALRDDAIKNEGNGEREEQAK